MIFAPDDFAKRPYGGGLNQMGHVVAGAALATVGPLAVALVAILAWEGWQFWKKGATKEDFRIDVVYWTTGAVTWPIGLEWWPFIPVAAFALEWARIKRASNGPE